MSEQSLATKLISWKLQFVNITNTLEYTENEIIDKQLPFKRIDYTYVDKQGNIYLLGSRSENDYLCKLSADLNLNWCTPIVRDRYVMYLFEKENKIHVLINPQKTLIVDPNNGKVSSKTHSENEIAKQDQERVFYNLNSEIITIQPLDTETGFKIENQVYKSDIKFKNIFSVKKDELGYWVIEEYKKEFKSLFSDNIDDYVYLIRVSRFDFQGQVVTQKLVGEYKKEFNLYRKARGRGRSYGPSIDLDILCFTARGKTSLFGKPLLTNNAFYVLTESRFDDNLVLRKHNFVKFDLKGKKLWEFKFPYGPYNTSNIYNSQFIIDFKIDNSVVLADENSSKFFLLFNKSGKLIKETSLPKESLTPDRSILYNTNDSKATILKLQSTKD